MIIKSRNLLHENVPKTYLSSGIAVGATTSPVRNTTGLTTSWAVQVGEVGGEQTEILIGTNASGTSITHPTSSFEHPADTPVYFIKYNQVVFERSTTGTAGAASPITNGTVTYQADSDFTIFDDTSGSASYAYRTYFRNSTLAVNSTESDWITSAGFDFYSLAAMRQRAKDKLWNAKYVSDKQIDDWNNEWKDELTNALVSLDENYALGTINVSFGTNGLGTITTADFKDVRRVWTTYNGSDKYLSTKMDPNDYDPNRIFSSVHPYHAYIGDNIIQISPAESGGTAELVIYRFGTTMVNDTDTLPVPMRPYTKSFVNYSVAQALFKDGKLNEYDRKLIEANTDKQTFIAENSNRDKSGPTFIDIVEPLTGEDGLLEL